MKWENRNRNVWIKAKDIEIGEDVIFGDNINIEINGTFKIGDYSKLGDNVHIRGNNVHFGDHLYHSSGLRVGGGGSGGPNANLTIGDRCTIHNNFLNVCEPIEIGNDVGLSQEVSLITHGYWGSVLEGYPRKFEGIVIGDNCILGYRTTVLPGVKIGEGVVVGACSVVTQTYIGGHSIFAGNPAKFIKAIEEPSEEGKISSLLGILWDYSSEGFEVKYPLVHYKGFSFRVDTSEYYGKETEETDHLRDYLRKWGIRIYTKRPFG